MSNTQHGLLGHISTKWESLETPPPYECHTQFSTALNFQAMYVYMYTSEWTHFNKYIGKVGKPRDTASL